MVGPQLGRISLGIRLMVKNIELNWKLGNHFRPTYNFIFSYIKHFCNDQTAVEYIERVRDARPLIRWYAETFHYEFRSQTRIQVISSVKEKNHNMYR